MCFSAEVERDRLRFRRMTGSDMNIHEFFHTYVKRQRGGCPLHMLLTGLG